MKLSIKPVKGTREFYPEAMALRAYIYEKVRAASRLFGYQEWDGPFLEPIELYAAKSGEELVEKQSFVFRDRDEALVALRPELTPSLARMIAARQNELTYPLRWWSFGPFWRYEQPQKGRAREFFQWNIDLLGVSSPQADAELIAVAATFLRSIGLVPARTKISVNDRRLMESEFEILQIPRDLWLKVSNLIDRRSKMDDPKWRAAAAEMGLKEQQIGSLLRILGDRDLWKKSPELGRLFATLRTLGVEEYIQYDPNIVRGLLYYTGTVFEAYDLSGSVKRAILGGGRYDNLLSDLGGAPLPGVGFAMGDVVVGILLQESSLLPEFIPSPAPVLVTVFDETMLPKCLTLAADLRKSGLNVMVYPEVAKLQKQFKFADRMKVRLVLTIGPDEAARGEVAIKDLVEGEQIGVPESEVAARIRQILER